MKAVNTINESHFLIDVIEVTKIWLQTSRV